MSTFTSTILITGGTSGLGYHLAYNLAQTHPQARILLISRTDKDNTAARLTASLRRTSARTNPLLPIQISFYPLDLSSQSSIRTFTHTTLPTLHLPPITILSLNAGLQFHSGTTLHYSPENIETTFAVNHVGHALLLFLLKPYLSPTARILITASGLHDPAQSANSKAFAVDPSFPDAETLAHPTDSDGYANNNRGLQRYAASKLANVLFLHALSRRLEAASGPGKAWTVAAFDPGLMPGTGLGREMGPVVMWLGEHVLPHALWVLRWVTGSGNVHRVETSAGRLAGLAERKEGGYWEGDREVETSVESKRRERQEDLWEWTIKAVARDEQERREFERF